jgi:hypothetical protein
MQEGKNRTKLMMVRIGGLLMTGDGESIAERLRKEGCTNVVITDELVTYLPAPKARAKREHAA